MNRAEDGSDESGPEQKPSIADTLPEGEAPNSQIRTNDTENEQETSRDFDRDLVEWTKALAKWTKIIGAATVFLFVVAIIQAWISQGQLSIMRDSNRPWVALAAQPKIFFETVNDDASPTQYGPPVPFFRVSMDGILKNGGTSPALQVVHDFAFGVSRESFTTSLQFSCWAKGNGPIMLPNAEMPLRLNVIWGSPSDRVPVTDLWFAPCVAYKDTRGSVHITRLCYHATGSNEYPISSYKEVRLNPCEDHNEAN